ncbi:MAG: FHA domain-containing protein, partial [Myxococcota bacterium]
MAGADIYAGTWVTYIGGRATSLRIRRCQVDIVAGCDAKASHVFESSVIRIGGKRVNDLALSDPKVSGIHLEICLDEKGYRLRDLGSTNGTYVNGMRIVDIWLAPGTIIQLGDTQLVFQPLRESVEHTLSARDRFGGWIGRSPVARELFARLERIAPSEATVLITGETGTGK